MVEATENQKTIKGKSHRGILAGIRWLSGGFRILKQKEGRPWLL
jgi:hypothetical protein